MVWADVINISHCEEASQLLSCAVYPALERSHRHTTDSCRLLVRKTLGSHQKERFALADGDLGECSPEVLEIEVRLLIRMCPQPGCVRTFRILNLPPVLAVL